MSEPDQELIVRGTSGQAKYNIKVEGGSFAKTDDTEANDKLYNGDRRAAGNVQAGGEDTFRFNGVIVVTGVAGRGTAEIEINGKVYDPADLPAAWQRDAEVYDDYAGSDETDHTDTDGGLLDLIRDAIGGDDSRDGDSDLQKDLDREFEKARQGPKERHSKVTLESSTLHTLSHTVHVNRNQVLDVNGSDLTTTESFDAITLDRGAKLTGDGGFDARSVENGDLYDATAITLDPMNMRIDPDDRNGASVDPEAWKPRPGEDKPDNEHRTHEVTRQNLSGTGVAIDDFYMVGYPADRSTFVCVHQGASPDGWICSSADMLTLELAAEDVAYPVVLDSESRVGGGYINDLDIRGYASGWTIGAMIVGEAIARKNTIAMDLQPGDSISEYHVVIDNPKAEDNKVEGTMWDVHRNATDMVAKCDRASGTNVIEDKTNAHDNDYREGDEAEKVNIIKQRGF